MNRKPAKKVGIWSLAKYLKSYRGVVSWTILFLFLGRVGSSLDPIWLKKIIDSIDNGSLWQGLIVLVVTYFAIRALTAFFDFLRDAIFAPAEMGIARTLSRELFGHLLNLPVGYHFDQKIGGLSRKITRGGRAITFILDLLVINILPTIVELILVTFLLFHLYTPVYAIVTFSTITLYAVFTIWSTEKRQKFRLGANVADDEVAGIEVDGLSNIETVKYFNNEGQMLERYEPAIEKRYGLAVKSNQLFALIEGVQGLILLFGLGIILLLAITQRLSGILTTGDLFLLTAYIVRLTAPINTLSFAYRSIKDGIADLDGMAKILEEDVDVSDPEHPVIIQDPKGEVTLDHVAFAYGEKESVFKDLNFTVKPGQRIAFVGPSGVGKSTIVKLLFRFFDPTGGKILIDGVDLKDLSRKQRRELFAIVPQEPALFNTTIAENIRFGKPDATQEEVEEAARLASIDTFVSRLPEKYETTVGERGVKLSGGEKQRVAIARAVIRGPKVLVFDEATSSLDSKSEREIQTSLDAISKGRTTIAVAHRLSTIAGSDIIYVLDKGEVVESGTHRQLLEKNGLYAKLWKIQAEAHSESDLEQ